MNKGMIPALLTLVSMGLYYFAPLYAIYMLLLAFYMYYVEHQS